jgi:hypothetical protein
MTEESPSENRRHFTRIPMDSEVTLVCGAQQWKSQLIDISLKGALLAVPEEFDEGHERNCHLMFSLNEADVTITMIGHIVYHKESHLGFHCDNIDLDSITHLKRMVELNLGDERMLERELGELLAAEQ